MKRIKLLLLIWAILMPMIVNADPVEIDGICYNLKAKGKVAEVTRNFNHSYSGDVIIPEKVSYGGSVYDVTSIGGDVSYNGNTYMGGAFRGCTGLTSVTIPNSVTSIGYGAFYQCSGLTSVNIPESVTFIGENAFLGCSGLTSLTIPESATSIGKYAFAGCSGLTSITIPSSWSSIGYGVFGDCTGLTSITIPDNIYNIDDVAFSGCTGLTSITIPNSVNGIGNQAFYGCTSLSSIIIPNSVSYIGNGAFSACRALTSIIIPESVTSIGRGTFARCTSLTSITIPQSVTSIGGDNIYGGAFSGCTSLTTIIIPNSVTSIGNQAFLGCDNLKIIKIGSGVRSIGNYAFMNCSKLTDIYCYAVNVPNINTDVFKNSYIDHATLHVPTESVDAYKSANTWKNFKSIVEIDLSKHYLIYIVDGVEYKKFEIKEGEPIIPEPEPTNENYAFSGWSPIPEIMPAEDVIVTGTFNNIYKLVYKVDGTDYKTLDIEYGTTITPETAPTKEGYTFSGWSEIPETMPAEDVTITGSFSINKYKLTYYLDGAVYQTSEVKYGTALTPISDPYVGLNYTFSGWSEVPETMPAHDVDITGTKVPKKYTLEYQLRDPISGTYSTYKTMEVTYGANITPEPAPTKEGYTFNGWTNIPATMPSYKVTVLGSFTVNSYTLTYQINGETYKSYKQKYGSTITPETAPTKDGFTFSGWGDVPATMPARDVTVNGSYTKNPTTNVTYPAEWNMTGWSVETVSNLESDTKWYKSEYRYSYYGSCPKDESIELTANGVKIKETAGVEFAVSNCTLFTISTKEGGLYNVNIEVYESSNFFFVLKNMKRGQKISIDFKSVDWYSSYDLFPQPVGAVKMTDRATTRAQRTESSVADYIVSADGDVRFNVNADKFFYLYNIDVTEVSEANLAYLTDPDGINDLIDCYLYWNGQTSSAIGPWGSSYARGAGVRIVNNSSQTMTITKIEMNDDDNHNIGTITDQNGDLAPGELKDFTFSVSSTSDMPSTLPWMEIHYTVNGIPYTKKFVSNGDAPTGIIGHRVDGEDSDHEDIYTIEGRKLSLYPTQKGIYIKNGKKFVVK